MLINLEVRGQDLDRDGIPKLATTNAKEHLLCVRHTKLSPRSPLEPLGALESLGNGSKSSAASTGQVLTGHSDSLGL